MSKYELKQNQGVVFRNKKKSKDTQPDFSGEIDVDGKRLNIALWERTTKNQDAYFSLKISEPQSQNNENLF